MKRLLLLLLAVFAVQSVVAQDIRIVHRANNQSITLGEEVTKEIVFERFGVSESINEFYDESYSADVVLYNYSNAIFRTGDNLFLTFLVKDKLFEVLINNQYSLKVGDNWPAFVAQLESEPVSFQMGEVYLRLYWGESTDYLGFDIDSNGIIRDIAWVVPV